ncbi:hypothetical protein [Xanthomonas citri]|uniref:hypothetical protein n=1 Tax=Xanthomonas citri TaxID=346 RepID=UPI0001CED39A|nr:hypothetical protein [Xanthomonas citri]AMV00084.1 hypothetical protein TP37_19895 [Xanthomonas citri pv. aurantifolii]AMV02091.1 hypothetical protein TP50_06235 [Xanthomonas citri pv. aurantifolii]EFF47360.1 hypothetical protein XAUC_22520 [Xanthomonas citri pv. aurantifolii str. ICPB 10535]MCC8490863.1 hypothetical protein [Xanthomonas citri pv. fuscans]TBW97975.1 hypothetical protein TP47_09635 [Xanthomonas citri pv. aurantifolii]
MKSTPDDPIDQLLVAGATVRMLLAHSLVSVEWLAQHRNDTFRMCYEGDSGELIVTDVAPVELLARARELGWKPSVDNESSASGPYLFDDASYHCRRGVHWYATANNDTDECLPLGFPARELQASQRRHERKYGEAAIKRAQAAIDRQKRMAEAEKNRIFEAKFQANVDLIADHFGRLAKHSGKPISDRTARRKALHAARRMSDPDYWQLLVDAKRSAATEQPEVPNVQ